MISIIIPTLNRQELLKKSILAILNNTKKVDEIIIIEQWNIEKTKNTLKDLNFNFKIFFSNQKSITKARNIWIEKSIWDYIFFIDDDLEIDNNYIEIWYNYLKNNNQVKIVSWKDGNAFLPKKSIFKKVFRFLLYQDTLNSERKILRSGQNTVYIDYEKPISSQWASWTMVVKKEVFKSNKFREDFIRWGFWEDIDFSYRVYKKYGLGSIIFLSNLIFNHIKSDQNRITNNQAIKMMFIYRYIFWKKEVYNNSFLSLFLYFYSEIFRAILHSRSYNNNKFLTYKQTLKTQLYIIKNYKKIDNNTIDYNTYILD